MTKGENRHARTDLYTRARADADARTRHAREMMARSQKRTLTTENLLVCTGTQSVDHSLACTPSPSHLYKPTINLHSRIYVSSDGVVGVMQNGGGAHVGAHNVYDSHPTLRHRPKCTLDV